MNSQEWMVSVNPRKMLRWLDKGNARVFKVGGSKPWEVATDRKLRLFACGVARQLWDRLDEESRIATVVAERYADGEATKAELEKVRWRKSQPSRGVAFAYCDPQAILAATSMVYSVTPDTSELSKQCEVLCANLLREVFGNPFDPIIYEEYCPWLTPTVQSIAQEAYENWCQGGTLGILADALEDAGMPSHVDCDCMNDWCPGEKVNPILKHLRSSDPHVRGCWVLDLLLGK